MCLEKCKGCVRYLTRMASAVIIECYQIYKKHRLRASYDCELLGFFCEGAETVTGSCKIEATVTVTNDAAPNSCELVVENECNVHARCCESTEPLTAVGNRQL
jgi:hypothetical protein